MDFYKIRVTYPKRGAAELFPDFHNVPSKDLMIRGGGFYAIWDEANNKWSQDPYDLVRLIDEDLDRYYADHKDSLPQELNIKYARSNNSRVYKNLLDYIKDLPDNYHQLDTSVTFQGDLKNCKRGDYVSKELDYKLDTNEPECFNELLSVLYSDEEQMKIRWLIGSVIKGDSKKNEKFFVFYGEPGTGKSTILKIISKLFGGEDGYCSPFTAKSLSNSGNQFPMEQLRHNPLIAIQTDGNLSRIEDNSLLNSIISHEVISVNIKHQHPFPMKPISMLLMATNSPVQITDNKSGIKRRLIDINPTGNIIPPKRYDYLMDQILEQELGSIANQCLQFYEEKGKNFYKNYEARDMQYMTDYFLNFVEENCLLFKNQNYTFLNQAYDLYKQYVEDAGLPYKITKQEVRFKLRDYFETFEEERQIIFNGERRHVRGYYEGFKSDMLTRKVVKPALKEVVTEESKWLDMYDDIPSELDKTLVNSLAQYATAREIPGLAWDKVTSILATLDTRKLHYAKCPVNLICIDFDLKDESGNKSFDLNYEEAIKWPKTYAELSKSGSGIHLHYWYEGDPEQLERLYKKDIEVKVFTGGSSLRRKLSKCNKCSIATLKEGFLKLKEKKSDDMVTIQQVKSDAKLHELIIRNLNKEIHSGTKPSIDFIYKILEDAYESGLSYDVTDLRPDIEAFALNSTNHPQYCSEVTSRMKFKSEGDIEYDVKNPVSNEYDRLVFYDIEVFPNLFLVNWKFAGPENKVVRMINPSPEEIRELMKYKLIGFNCRRYDNHIIYARAQGYTIEALYDLSKRIINKSNNAFFRDAYDVSYTDVYDFCKDKMSLKKWEIKLHIHHHELGMNWDKPVPEEKWKLVAEYCDDDVLATEAVWDANQASFLAREILADIAGMNVNATTNTLTTRIIFGKNKSPQSDFCYRKLSEPVNVLSNEARAFLEKWFPEMMAEPFIGPNGERSLLPFFPGYVFENGKSYYRGIEVGEGGEVWAAPGMYHNVWTFDVTSMHPHSALAEYLFGRFTEVFGDLVLARKLIKHKDFEAAGKLFDGKLKKYLTDPEKAKLLADALKIAINSVYGLTAASFENAFRDPRNIDNIVAKRGALFMIDLLYKVQELGGTVIHIKTDSIKIVDPTPELREFIESYGKRHGYTFEVEHIFEKICLVNNAVYIGKLSTEDPEWLDDCRKAERDGKPKPTRWTATGTQFAVPYVFKTLFSKEDIEFDDLCETKQVTDSLYLDLNEGLPDVTRYEKELTDRKSTKLKLKDNGLYLYRNPDLESLNNEDLEKKIAEGHSYRFVGKIGLFTPIKDGCGGGALYRSPEEGKYNAVTGTKGFKWLESEIVQQLGKDGDIDLTYYDELVTEAKNTISQFGDFETFAA